MRGAFYSLFSLALVSTAFVATRAAEIRSGDKVTIAADEMIDDDLYVFGKEIIIDGTVDGDVCAFGQQIRINGTVTGNVMAAGQTIVIVGQAGGARIAGQVLKVDSTAKLTGDLLAAGFSLECDKGSTVVGDALFAGYQALFAGSVGADLRASMSNCLLAGTVGGDVDLEVGGKPGSPSATKFGPSPPVEMPEVPGGLTVDDTADIKGDLDYQSEIKGEIDDNASIAGNVNFHQQLHVEKEGGEGKAVSGGISSIIFKRVRHILSVGLIGLMGLLLFPRWTSAWADTLRQRPVASFFSGIIGSVIFLMLCLFLLFAIPVLALIVFGIRITELGPLVLVGGIVGYAGFVVGFWVVTMFLAEALAGMTIGRFATSDSSIGGRLGAMIVGVILLGIVLSVPVLGWLIGVIVMLAGLGSICLWLVGQSPAQAAPSITAPAAAVVA